MVPYMKIPTLSLAIAVSLVLAGSAVAQDKGGAGKMKASGKKAAGLAGCYAKALARGDLSFVTPCTTAVSSKFTAAFDKLETKFPGTACLTHNDRDPIEGVIDSCTQAIFEALRNNCGDGV